MHILTLLAKIIDDVTLSKFESWEENDVVYYSGRCISEEVMSILNKDNVIGNCVVAFKADENNYFVVDSIECNGITHFVSKAINEYIESQGWYDIYHRLCEEAVR